MTREEDYQLARSLRKDPIEDTFVHATSAQIAYIEKLRLALNWSLSVGYMKMSGILKHDVDNVWSLSRSEASQIIDQFKKWKEER